MPAMIARARAYREVRPAADVLNDLLSIPLNSVRNYFDRDLLARFQRGELPRAGQYYARDMSAANLMLSLYPLQAGPPARRGDLPPTFRVDSAGEYLGSSLDAGARPRLESLGKKLSPGQLGLFVWDRRPDCLLFKAVRQHDPRVAMLKGEGWKERVFEWGSFWHAEPTLENYFVLYDTGLELSPTPRLASWLLEAGGLPPLLQTSGAGRGPLFDFQRQAVAFLLSRKRAMLSLSPGLGKTAVAAFSAAATGANSVLVVAPASLLHYWVSELAKWSPHLPLHPFVHVWHRECGAVPSYLPQGAQFWAISNPETVSSYLEEFEGAGFDILVADESIMYKNRNADRSLSVRKLAEKAERTWLLTGAPATKTLADMWHQFHMLNQKGYSSYWRFAKRYCVVEENQWGSSIVANKRGAEELIKRNFADIYFARSQDEVLDLPDWLFEDVDIPMEEAQEQIYLKLQRDLKLKLSEYEPAKIIRITNQLSLVTRSLQAASNPMLLGAVDSSGKWDALSGLMEVYPGPYLIWVNYIRTGEVLRTKLRADLINGSTPIQERNELVEKFQAGDTGVLILNNQIGKFGFNLTKARTAFFLERGYDDSYFQALHRFRRIGTEHRPVVVNMRSITQSGSRTIDHVVGDVLDYRNSMIRRITCEMIQNLEDE